MSDLRFSESHEWFAVDGKVVTLGITRFATEELTDITYVELKPVDSEIAAGETVGEVESVKTTSDVFSVVSGRILEVNQEVVDDPALVNEDPQGRGWLVRLETNDARPLDALMDQTAYDDKNPVV